MEGTVEIARAITITYQTHRPNGKRQKSFDLDLCNRTVRIRYLKLIIIPVSQDHKSVAIIARKPAP